jgi:PRTRC genetic system protein B
LQAQISLSSTTSFELREALLVYRTHRESHRSTAPGSFVTKHPVTLNAQGAPSLGAGAPLGKSDLTDLLKQLHGSISVEFLPANVLARTLESTVWWMPPAIRPMFYAKEKGGGSRSALRQEVPSTRADLSCSARQSRCSRRRVSRQART